jgi:hypothetical protein
LNEVPRCGRCQTALPESFPTRLQRSALLQPEKVRRSLSRGRALVALVTVVFVTGAGLGGTLKDSAIKVFSAVQDTTATNSGTGTSPRYKSRPTPQAPMNICRSYPQPVEGVYQQLINNPVAPLTIRTAQGSNYFTKLEDAATGDLIQTAFVYGGSTFTTKVPLGYIILKYATGEHWCGEDELFGPDTSRYRADKVFHFDRRETEDGYVISGHTVELILQPNGNLGKVKLDRSAF